MSDQSAPRPPLVPFVIADVLFLGMALLIFAVSHRPLLWWEACLMVGCGSAAAWSLTAPFLRQDRNEQAHTQVNRLADLTGQLGNLERLTSHIHAATEQWKAHEAQSGHSLQSAKQLTEALASESRAFSELLQKTGDSEKNHLKLEVEKLRRNEAEWLQTVTRILDHIYALFQAAQRSGQRSLFEQISLFQDSCRESARRIGLVPLVARPGDVFDARLYQLRDGATPPEKSLVGETLATGFTYQGQLIRRALVALQTSEAPQPDAPPSQQNDLPLTEETNP